ncbi:MAG: histidine phosphatase family protein [Alphaproteobacteria bacterium]|nr:histidine phosphatase family protein [Alphaproteobacteria bacterium]
MTLLALIRHGPTAWNTQKRIQGRTDEPLSAQGRADVAAWRVPPALTGLRVYASPLSRAQDTAALLFGASETEPRLIEMSWGAWEGRSLPALRTTLGSVMTDNEAQGFDFRPDGGESPREVLARVRSWIEEVAMRDDDTVAVTHRGVIRVVMAAAYNWNMLGKPPVKLRSASAHLFDIGAGTIRVRHMNVALTDDAP